MDDMAFACRYGRETHNRCTKCGAFIYRYDSFHTDEYGGYICLNCWEKMIEEDEEEEEVEDEQGIRE